MGLPGQQMFMGENPFQGGLNPMGQQLNMMPFGMGQVPSQPGKEDNRQQIPFFMMPGQGNEGQGQQVPMLQMMMQQGNQMNQLGQLSQLNQMPMGLGQSQQKNPLNMPNQENPSAQQQNQPKPQTQPNLQGFQGINPMVTSPEALQNMLRSLNTQ